ncbi:PAS domain-containing protein [Nitrospira sp. MA-1]|nr:PAS domain-containing protein [Nitrospira sp. MA-1]
MPSEQEKFRIMADTMPGVIWIAGMDTRGTYFNKSWLMFTGRTLEETLRTTWTEAVHPDDRQRGKDGQYC